MYKVLIIVSNIRHQVIAIKEIGFYTTVLVFKLLGEKISKYIIFIKKDIFKSVFILFAPWYKKHMSNENNASWLIVIVICTFVFEFPTPSTSSALNIILYVVLSTWGGGSYKYNCHEITDFLATTIAYFNIYKKHRKCRNIKQLLCLVIIIIILIMYIVYCHLRYIKTCWMGNILSVTVYTCNIISSSFNDLLLIVPLKD